MPTQYNYSDNLTITPASSSEPVALHDIYDAGISPGYGGAGGGLDGTAAGGTAGIDVIGISTDGVNFTPVPSGTMQGDGPTVDATYQSFSSDSAGDSNNEPVDSAQAIANAINENNLTGTGPLTDNFYYEVQDASGNTAIDEFTDTYGDVDVNAPSSASLGTTIDDAPGQTISLDGFTATKMQSTDANADNPDLTNPNLQIGISAFDYNSQTESGTFAVNTSVAGGGGSVSTSDGGIVISGTESQINADLTTLTYTGEDPGQYYLNVYTVDNSYLVDPSGYQSATYVYAELDIACFLAGTRILTEHGEVAIEQLSVGDAVVIARKGTQAARRVLWTGHRQIDCTRHPNPQSIWPVLIRKDAVAPCQPSRDLWVSPGHSIFIEGVLMQAENLINGTTILQVPAAQVDYWHVELDSHDILFAEGLPTESYLDTGNRTAFLHGGEYLEIHPDFRPKHWSETCVPLVFEGPEMERTKDQLLSRAQALGFRLTADDDLHVMADGHRVEPVSLGGMRVAFILPAGGAELRLHSRTFTPAHITATSRDKRALGICVGRLQIDGTDIRLDDGTAFATAGWHELEREGDLQCWRWTSGSTALPAGTRLLVIDRAAAPGRYWAGSCGAQSSGLQISA